MRIGDQIDTLVHYDWRPGRLQILGIAQELGPDGKFVDKLEPRERLGKLRCTLGSVQTEGEGSAYSVSKQNWPEFRNSNGRLLQRSFMAMSAHRRALMDARYVWNGIFPVKVRADALGLSLATFWVEVAQMKTFIEGFIASAKLPQDEIYV